MAARTLISVEEYLKTSYRPDCDYVDGEVRERIVGEYDHARLHKVLVFYLAQREKEWGIEVVPEQRVQVGPGRFRVPDLCVVLDSAPREQVFTKPPFLCIEILSPEDRLSRVEERVDDYLAMGVPYVWVLDPVTKRAWEITPAHGWREVKSGVLRTENPALEVPLVEIFEG
jgi:Uma2 family endonuclease